MTDTSDSFATRGSRTTPEAIAERQFSQVKRGYAESEVRAYLRMVSSDFAAAAARERDLAARVRELEEQARKPKLPPTDQDLITALGEETARVLGQARESALELRAKAEEHARRVVREAQETARELRATTQQAVEAKTREAEDAARSRAKEIVGEARTLRERVLGDLNDRRQELERQVAELRGGRGKLVETYEIVERALTHAVRVMAEEPSTPPDVPAADAPEVAEEARVTDEPPTVAAPPVAPAPPVTPVAPVEPVAEPAPDAQPASEEVSTAETTGAEPTPDVGALFKRLRSGQADDAPAAGAADATTEPPAPEPTGAAIAEPAVEPTPESEPEPDADSDSEPEPDDEATDDETSDDETSDDEGIDQPATAARDAALADATDDLVRRGKRALQDEQNDLLDGLRRQRGKIDTGKVLPALPDQLARWAHVLQPAVDAAYAAGAASVAADAGGPTVGSAPRALLTEVATTVVAPLRERLEGSLQSIDARTPADTEIAIAQSLGARYREWRGEQLEGVLGDALAVAYSRGVFDAAPDGSRLRWVPAVVGKCPDCDDNALEPTVKGSDFPTGQAHPPAHPGCRCLLVVEAS
jgi:DivIVA domain-containing protein